MNRWRARRRCAAPASSAARSGPGRQADVTTVGSANSASRLKTGSIEISKAKVMPSRKSQPQVANSDAYM